MADALESGDKRLWCEVTSQEYAKLCVGTVYLVTEASEIWSESIWLTYELDAIWNSGLVTRIVEVRPEEIGAVYDTVGNARNVPQYSYRELLETIVSWMTD